MIFCAHLKRTSLNTYQRKKQFPIKVVKKNVMSNRYFLPVLCYSRQELLHCLTAQEIRGSKTDCAKHYYVYISLFIPSWHCVYITGGSTTRLAYTSSQKHPLSLHLWVPKRNTQTGCHVETGIVP